MGYQIMRRSSVSVLATVSLLALASATAAAVQPAVSYLGVLKPREQWKVGVVDAKGAPYCAMVSRFDQAIVMAFARSSTGYGSVAIDVQEKIFKPGDEYRVVLATDGLEPRTFAGRASAERSLSVQIGRDDAFYEALSDGGALRVSLPAMSASFSLAGFSGAYRNLVDCTGALNGKKDAMASATPLDRELEKLSGDKPKAAPVAAVERSALSDMEATLDREAAAENNKSDIVWNDPPKAEAGRRLLATTGGNARRADGVSMETGLTAQLLDREQSSRLEQSAQDRQQQIAALEKAQAEAARRQAAEFERQRLEAAQQARAFKAERDALAQKRDVSAAPQGERALNAGIVAAQAKLVRSEEQNRQQAARKAVAMEETGAAYDSRITALQTERDSLKRQLDQALSFNAMVAPRAPEGQKEGVRRDAEIAALEKRLQELETERVKPQGDEGIEWMRGASTPPAQKKGPSIEEVEKSVEAMDENDAAAVPAVPAPPVARARIPASASQHNRAAAFLDRIISYHRGDTPPPPPVSAPSKKSSQRASELERIQPAAGTPDESFSPAAAFLSGYRAKHKTAAPASAPKADVVREDRVEDFRPVEPTLAEERSIEDFKPVAPAAASIEQDVIPDFEAPAPVIVEAPAKEERIVLTPPAGFVPKKVAAAEPAPVVKAPPAPERLSLEGLLREAGIRNVRFIPVENLQDGEAARRWTADGGLTGLYEKVEAAGDFSATVQDYIDRYREDCPGSLKADLGDTFTSSAGSFAVADLSCGMPSNGYSTSLLFLQDGTDFSAILHAGHLGDTDSVRAVGAGMIRALGDSAGFIPPGPAPRTARLDPSFEIERAAAAQLKFNIVDAPVAAAFAPRPGDDEFETVVIR